MNRNDYRNLPDAVCTPRRKNRIAEPMAAVLLGTALLFSVYASFVPPHSAFLFRVLSTGCGLCAVWMLMRWCLTRYRYELHGDTLVVVRLFGKKEIPVCNLTLKTACGLFSKGDRRNIHRLCGRIRRAFHYECTLMSEQVSVYVYQDARSCFAVVLEPDPPFLAELRRRMTVCGEPDCLLPS